MSAWDYADRHPWLFFLALVLACSAWVNGLAKLSDLSGSIKVVLQALRPKDDEE